MTALTINSQELRDDLASKVIFMDYALDDIIDAYHKATSKPYGVIFMDDALENCNNMQSYRGGLAFEAAEIRASGMSAYLERNNKAMALCRKLGYLNSQYRKLTGKNLFSRKYELEKDLREKHIPEMMGMIHEFQDFCDEILAYSAVFSADKQAVM